MDMATMMFAVVRTGGKQYRISPGTHVDVEKLSGESGDEIRLSDVLLLSDGDNVLVGRPLVQGATVVAQIVEQKKAKKVITFKKIRRHGKRLKKGHRQEITRLLIKEIVAGRGYAA